MEVDEHRSSNEKMSRPYVGRERTLLSFRIYKSSPFSIHCSYIKYFQKAKKIHFNILSLLDNIHLTDTNIRFNINMIINFSEYIRCGYKI